MEHYCPFCNKNLEDLHIYRSSDYKINKENKEHQTLYCQSRGCLLYDKYQLIIRYNELQCYNVYIIENNIIYNISASLSQNYIKLIKMNSLDKEILLKDKFISLNLKQPLKEQIELILKKLLNYRAFI